MEKSSSFLGFVFALACAVVFAWVVFTGPLSPAAPGETVDETTATSSQDEKPTITTTPACKHDNPSKIVVLEAKKATCTEAGLTEGKRCSICDEVLVVQETVMALGHTEVVDKAVAPTCAMTGLTEGSHCSVCNETLVVQEIVPATDKHNYIITVAPPTATEDGYTEHTCSVCGVSYKDSYVKPINFTVTATNRARVGYTGEAGENLVIPAVFQENGVWYRVTRIYEYAFNICSNLESIMVPDSITSIGAGAFSGCSRLTSITIPGRVTSIGAWAFSGCSRLTSITIPDRVTSIGDHAFYGCSSLTSITIPDSVTSIGNYAFEGCSSLTSVTIGKSVTSIGNEAFRDCYKLVEIINKSSLNITAGSSNYGYVAYYAKAVHNGDSKIVNKDNYLFITSGGVNYLCDYVGNETELTLPANYNGQNYEIHDYAFKGCYSLTSITIPDRVTSIGNYAFCHCSNLTSVTIGNNVTSIGNYAFYGCSNLTSVTIGNNVTSIGNYAFSECLKLVEVYNLSPSISITKGSSGFAGVGYYALDVYTSKDTPSKLWTDSDGYIFYEDGEIRYLISYTGSDKELILPAHCNGKSYAIHKNAFYSNQHIKSVTIPNSVTSIGDYAFFNCSLSSFIFKGTKDQWQAISKVWTWDAFITYYTIYCTDGNIKVSE